MTASKQIESLISKLNEFADEALSQEMQDHMQEAYSHLEDVQMALEGAGL